jgi:hypothetical protein
MAQTAPVRVIQGSDGTLYVVQGGSSWTLVPDQASDSDVAALTPGGEIDGTLPDSMFIVQAPAAPAPAAAAPPPAASAPAPTPVPAAAQPTPITGTANLTGKAGSDLQSATLLGLGANITSTVDLNTKPYDVYAVNLAGGHKYQMYSSTSNKYGNSAFYALVLNPDGTVANMNFVFGGYNLPGCYGPGGEDTCSFTVAVDGTYYIKMQAGASAQNYTFNLKQVS